MVPRVIKFGFTKDSCSWGGNVFLSMEKINVWNQEKHGSAGSGSRICACAYLIGEGTSSQLVGGLL